MEAGRRIRNRRVGTVLLPGAYCNSACSLIFFAGTDSSTLQSRRIAFPGARIGVHSAHLRTKDNKPMGEVRNVDPSAIYAALQDRIGRVIGYLNQMKVPPIVQERLFSTPSQAIHFLTEDEKAATEIVRVSRVGGRWTAERPTRPLALPTSLSGIATAERPADAPAPAALSTPSAANSVSASGPRLPAFAGPLGAALPGATPILSAPSRQAAAATRSEAPTPPAPSPKPAVASPALIATGRTHVTYLSWRAPGQRHGQPRTVGANWVAEAQGGETCVKIYTDLKTNLLDLVFCKREGWIEMTLHYGTQLLDAWHEAKAVSFASLTGPEEAWPVTVQRQASLGAGASATQRLHLGATGLAGKLGDAASVYQVTIKFDLGNAQEITIFMPPDLRAVLGPKAS